MPKNVVRRFVEIDASNVRWLEETYPGASLTGMLNLMLDKFREVHEKTPADYAEIAARSLRG